MKPNVELLNRTLDYIRTHPKEWQQSSWVCGSSACFAGHALRLAGHVVSEGPSPDYGAGIFPLLDGKYCVNWWGAGAEVLGISEDCADDLFSPYNTLPMLEEKVLQITVEAQREEEREEAAVFAEAQRVIATVELKEPAPL